MIDKILKILYFIFFSIYKNFKYPSCKISTNFIMPSVKLGRGVIVRKGCKIQKNVVIDDYTSINENTQIDTNTKYIGKYCSISHGVKIGMGPHPLSFVSTSTVFYDPYRGVVDRQLYDEFKDKGFTKIGHDVLIGTNAVILAGVNIGTGAVVAAGSIVVKNVPPYAIVGGNPAEILKYRFNKKTIDHLLKIEWWNMDVKLLFTKLDYMSDVSKFIKECNKND